MFTSSTPLVMLPLPSAMNEPMRAKKAPETSEPLIENAYWPLRLAVVKPPTGGGGVTTEPLPPHAAAKSAATRLRNSARRFIARLPSGQRQHLQGEPCWIESRREREGTLAWNGSPGFAGQPAPGARGKQDLC